MFDTHELVPSKRSPQESLQRIVRVLKEEAAALAGEEPAMAGWLTRISDHLAAALSQ